MLSAWRITHSEGRTRRGVDEFMMIPVSQDLLRRIEALERRLTPPKDVDKIESFGSRIRGLRHRAKWSQSDVIGDVGISKAYLSDLENDKRVPGAEVLHRLARKFGVSMDYLWTGE